MSVFLLFICTLVFSSDVSWCLSMQVIQVAVKLMCFEKWLAVTLAEQVVGKSIC